jgi:DNA-binding FadR family transcriptional regulator
MALGRTGFETLHLPARPSYRLVRILSPIVLAQALFMASRGRVLAYWNHLDTDMLRWRLEITDTDTYLRKVFEMRLATEPAASAIAARFADASDRARIMRAFDAMVATGSDNLLWVEADLEFHKAIYLATHNEFFWPIGQLFNLGRSARYSPSQRKDRNERARWRSTEI